MQTHVSESEDQTSQLQVPAPAQRASDEQQGAFVDNRSEAIAQRKRQELIDNSPQVQSMQAFQRFADASARSSPPLQSAAATPVQRAKDDGSFQAGAAQRPNRTGLPDNLKSGIESLSGMSMDHVKVHYNSSQPAQLRAHAYAQGSEIHVAPGQERHLPHEAWHVVQQAQGRVKPTMQMKGGVPVNDDAGLEAEADAMGAKALASVQLARQGNGANLAHAPMRGKDERAPIQAVWDVTDRFKDGKTTLAWHQIENQLQWFYDFDSKGYFFIVEGTIPVDENYEAIHEMSYVQQEWGPWQNFIVKPPAKFGPQDGRHLTPEQRYETVKSDPGFVAPVKEANQIDLNNALDKGLSGECRDKFLAMAERVNPEAQAKQSLTDKYVYFRIPPTFNKIKEGLEQKKLEPTPDLIKKINETLLLTKRKLTEINTLQPATAARELKAASEALSEVTYAAIILMTNTVQGGYVLGAQGPVWSPERVKAPDPEVKHGGLPPLDVINLEVDGYYQSSDGVLHADEVKDTPRAMAEKVKKGEQLGRQVKWLEKPAFDQKTRQPLKKQVSYYVQAPGPGFDNILDERVINNLKLIEQKQDPNPELVLIHVKSFTMDELEFMFNTALKWLEDSEPVLKRDGIKLGAAAQKYFGNLPTAIQSLKDGPLKM